VPELDVVVESVSKEGEDVVVKGEVPARCAVGYYHVEIRVKGGKLVSSSCECGSDLCPHAVKLFLRYRGRMSR
jgi:uncharacterized membrane protein